MRFTGNSNDEKSTATETPSVKKPRRCREEAAQHGAPKDLPRPQSNQRLHVVPMQRTSCLRRSQPKVQPRGGMEDKSWRPADNPHWRVRPARFARTAAISAVHVYLEQQTEQTAFESNPWQARWTRLQRPCQRTQLPTDSR